MWEEGRLSGHWYCVTPTKYMRGALPPFWNFHLRHTLPDVREGVKPSNCSAEKPYRCTIPRLGGTDNRIGGMTAGAEMGEYSGWRGLGGGEGETAWSCRSTPREEETGCVSPRCAPHANANLYPHASGGGDSGRDVTTPKSISRMRITIM
ncbi:hypothetical protein JZ751_026962, partial [Albula glossodonta]